MDKQDIDRICGACQGADNCNECEIMQEIRDLEADLVWKLQHGDSK